MDKYEILKKLDNLGDYYRKLEYLNGLYEVCDQYDEEMLLDMLMQLNRGY